VHFGSTVIRRLAVAGVCVLSLVLCCGLALWQWDRFSSAGGTYQNLGYVLQWPLFGLFPAFMFWRIRVLSRRAAEESDATEGGEPAPADTVPVQSTAERQGSLAPHSDEEPDDELAAYNRYLAELHRRDQRD
jgi:DNA-binding transcriptional regulator of glucitol operon